MEVFPHILCRIGGISFDELTALEASETMKHIEHIAELRTKLETERVKLCELLHTSIAAQTDHKLQNQLLNAKRSIFNGKSLKEKEAEETLHTVSGETETILRNFLKLESCLQQRIKEAELVFNRETIASREHLKKLAGNEELQKGLLLSSQTLLQAIQNYSNHTGTELRKKELKTEESLLKYLSRMGAKTSPFSTFTNLSLGKVVDQRQGSILQAEKGGRKVSSHVCLNNLLYNYIRTLLYHLPEVYRWFKIRPNPTISIESENYLFLTNNNNIEAFQRIGANPVVELFYELTKDQAAGIVYEDLIKDIIENEYFDAEKEEIEEYINQLVSYGFLEFNIGVSGIDPHWDYRLVEILDSIQEHSSLIADLSKMLKDVRGMAQAYGSADLEGRKTAIAKAFDRLRATCMQLHAAAGLPEDERKTQEELAQLAAEKKKELEAKKETETAKEEPKAETSDSESEEAFTHKSSTYFHFKAEQLFYEDTTVGIAPQLSQQEISSLTGSLHQLLSSLQNFEGFLDEKEKMQQYFLQKYEKNAVVSLTRFYEDYFREVKKPEAEQQNKAKEYLIETRKKKAEAYAKGEAFTPEKGPEEKPILEIPVSKARSEANKAFSAAFAKAHFERNEIRGVQHIRPDQLPSPEPYTNAISFGAFAQVFEENGQTKAVINNAFPGFGKMFSRFLHILPEQLTADIRQWNSSGQGESIFIENCDASFFNANLHPPLLPHEVWMPGGHNSLPASEQIPVTELNLCFSEEKNCLQLQHASGKAAYIFDLGFQGYRGRSQLFQLLAKFTLIKYISWHPLTHALSLHINPKENWETLSGPIESPRIVFDNKLVLQRRSWQVKKEHLPSLDPGESEWSYFLKVNTWRKKYDIPDEVFVFMTNHGEMENLTPEQMKKLGRDGYKPQYIDFSKPVFVVNLLEKMIEKVAIYMKIEEMLPGSKDLLKAGDKRYVSEFVVQWYDNTTLSAKPSKTNHTVSSNS